MKDRAITLMIRVRVEQGNWSRFPAHRGGNSRIRAGWAEVDEGGKEPTPKPFTQYTYQARSYGEGGKVIYTPLGSDPLKADKAVRDMRKDKTARTTAADANLTIAESEGGRLRLDTSATRYIASLKAEGKYEAADAYGFSVDQFKESAKNKIAYLDQVNRDLMLDFWKHLRKRRNSERTIANRHGHIKSFLLWAGLDNKTVAKMIGKPPKYDAKVVIAYHRDELSTLFGHAQEHDPYFFGVLTLLLMSGVRDREGTHLTWPEIDWKRGQIKLTAKRGCRDCVQCRKNDKGFTLKDREERLIPIHADLMAILRKRHEQNPNSRYVFGDENDKPHTKWLRMLKRMAREAGLNCGHCEGCRDYVEKTTLDGGCSRWTLHSFRRTFATSLLREGANVKQIMQMLGHSDLETTMKYLAAAEAEENAVTLHRVKWLGGPSGHDADLIKKVGGLLSAKSKLTKAQIKAILAQLEA
jgi:integrase